MNDIAETFDAMREHQKDKRRLRLKEADAVLNLIDDIDYRILTPYHWRLCTDPEIDFWPSTGKWKIRGEVRCRFGLDALIRYVEQKGKLCEGRKKTK